MAKYTFISPVLYTQYFERIDEYVPIPAPDKVIDKFNTNTTDLSKYIRGNLKDVVTKISLSVDSNGMWSNQTDLELTADVTTTRELTRTEINELRDYLEGQYSDGWGENGWDFGDGHLSVWWDAFPGISCNF